GSTISAERSTRKLFEKIFVQGKASEVEARVEALRQGQSTLDFVAGQAKRLQRSLSKNDQEKVDQYFTSVRDLEQRLHSSEAWEYKAKPVVDAKAPEDIEDAKEFVMTTAMMFDVIQPALQPDASPLITLCVD